MSMFFNLSPIHACCMTGNHELLEYFIDEKLT